MGSTSSLFWARGTSLTHFTPTPGSHVLYAVQQTYFSRSALLRGFPFQTGSASAHAEAGSTSSYTWGLSHRPPTLYPPSHLLFAFSACRLMACTPFPTVTLPRAVAEVGTSSHSLALAPPPVLTAVIPLLTRRGSGVRITDLAETLGYVFGYRNMKKAAILDPNAKKN